MIRRTRGFSRSTGTPSQIEAWSYSRLSEYEDCPRKSKYKLIDKLPDPPGPAMERGSRIHSLCEGVIKGTIERYPSELDAFGEPFDDLLQHVDVQAEAEWAFAADWTPTTWFNTPGQPRPWVRIKVDAVAFIDDARETLRVIDFKTGRIRKSHEKQLQLYALGAFLKHETVQTVSTELWYLDEHEIIDLKYERSVTPKLQKAWERRGKQMTSDTTFRPRPGSHCRYCPFSKAKGGPCEAG